MVRGQKSDDLRVWNLKMLPLKKRMPIRNKYLKILELKSLNMLINLLCPLWLSTFSKA